MKQHRSTPRFRKRPAVFLDVRDRRASWLKAVALLSGFGLLAWLAALAIGISAMDILPDSGRIDHVRDGTVAAEAGAGRPGLPLVDPTCPGAARTVTPPEAFLQSPGDLAVSALRQDCTPLGGLLVNALEIDPLAGRVDWADRSSVETVLRTLAANGAHPSVELVALLPLPETASGVPSVLEDPGVRAGLVADLIARIGESGAAGVCLYPNGFQFVHLDGLRALLTELSVALPPGATSCLIADASGPLWRDGGVIGAVDSVVLRAFREPEAGTPPGPLAPQDWFDGLIDEARAAMDGDKLRVALGAFGYLWTDGAPGPLRLSYAEAMRLAARAGGKIVVDPASLNTQLSFTDAQGRRSEIWLLDAVSVHNQLLSLTDRGAARRLLWPVGSEDPGAWPLLARGRGPITPGLLETVSLDDVILYVGDGPFRKIVELARIGQRRIAVDPGTRRIVSVAYDAIPRPFTVNRYGALSGKVVALTFDDGPDAAYTAEILDVLKLRQVPATFFVIGANVVQSPDLVRRMVDEGHEVGSHTFFHPGNENTGADRLRLELNAVQRLLASISGRVTYLFRTPYGRSEGPMSASEAEQQLIFESAGLVVAGGDIVPRDWEGLGAEAIVEEVMRSLPASGGQVVVLHDAGGDRSATVAAVPLLIDRLRAAGYDFVPLSRFIGLTRDEVMPLAADRLTPLDLASLVALSALGHALVWVFWGGIAFGLLRSLMVLGLSLLRRRHPVDDGPAVSAVVVIPAFNEELVVGDAIRAALASDYPDLRVIVVDDGSTDDTAGAVLRDFGTDPRVRLIRQPNGGKWSALNAAYAEIDAEIVVAVDADTLLDPDAVGLLAAHFRDPRVGAVAGTVVVGNRRGLLPRLQALEYTTAQNIDRRAAERLNAMLVVPGAIGAWRAEAVRKTGLYTPDTTTEDADLTIAVIRAGYRVVFEDRAVSTTDAVDTLHGFMKQRLRWTFGMMQTAWKHRRAARTAGAVGRLALPDLWLTGIGLGLIAPIIDAVALGALVTAVTDLAQGQPLTGADMPVLMIAGWLMLPLMDVLVMLTAFAFDRRAPWSLVLLAPVQRLIYRPLLYVTVYRAVGLALAGHIAGWGKLIRRGRVERPAA